MRLIPWTFVIGHRRECMLIKWNNPLSEKQMHEDRESDDSAQFSVEMGADSIDSYK